MKCVSFIHYAWKKPVANHNVANEQLMKLPGVELVFKDYLLLSMLKSVVRFSVTVKRNRIIF